MQLPARGVAAFASAIRFGLLLLSAVAQPLAALLPYGCGTPLAGAALPILWECTVVSVYRQSLQCGERSNAAFRKQSAAKQSSLAPHDSKARLRDVTTRRRSMAKPCTPHLIPQAEQLFKPQTGNVGGRGALPSRSLGGSKGPFSFAKENGPLTAHSRTLRENQRRSPFGLLPLPRPPGAQNRARALMLQARNHVPL